MAASHVFFKPLRHAGVASQDRIYMSGAAVREGSPVVFSSGKVIEATDGADGGVVDATQDPTLAIVGVALNATTAANQDVLVALAYPGRGFVGSHADNTTNGGTDGGTKAIALADIGLLWEVHLDATSLKWVVGAVSAAGKGGVLIVQNIDKVGSTTFDTRSFGEVGRGVGSITPTPPNNTWDQDPPAGPNFGTARVEFVFPSGATIFGVAQV